MRAEAIYNVYPAVVSTIGKEAFDKDGNIVTLDGSVITIEVAKLQAEYDAQAYSRNRQAEYPSIQECVHAILDDDLDALQDKRADIKLKYPKG